MDRAQIFESKEPEDETYVDAPGFKKVFINAQVVSTGGVEWVYNEGCLSIPKVREDVLRPAEVTLSYMDENFVAHTETFKGISARVILHEYDHIDGVLFTDKLSALKKKIIKGKLTKITAGDVSVDYKMRFPK
jgi:peptide deformylase